MDRYETGMTLIEMLVSMVISAVIFIFAGLIIIYTIESWKKAEEMTRMINESRGFRSIFEFQVRSAVTDPTGGSSYNFRQSGNTLIFDVVDRTTGSARYKRDRFIRSGEFLEYNYTYAETGGGGLISYPATTDGVMMLLGDISNLNYTVDSTDVSVDLEQTRNLPSGKQINVKTKFKIKTRNLR